MNGDIQNDSPSKRTVTFNSNPIAEKKSKHDFCAIGTSSSEIKNQLAIDRRQLPIYAARKRLIEELKRLDTAIVIGETGSGKTTQIPQYVLEAGIHHGATVACTQPRRVAAITVAQRVAAEKGVELGQLVGYSVRFDDMTSTDSKLIYLTDGMLLRESLLDPHLKRYSVVVLDEAHERTVHTDVLFGVVKAAQRRRANHQKHRPLKIIVMSATMDVDQFSAYFDRAQVLYVEGRQHPIKLMYAKEHQSDYVYSSVVSTFQIHTEAPPNEDILIFLTGAEEIEAVVKSIRQISHDLPSTSPPLIVSAMYAALSPAQQLKVFQKTPKGSRKVIVATNVAETSVTISGIKYVIDSGMVKTKSFNPSTGLDLLCVQRISQAQAWQRTGRAGREASGTCYRLYTENEFDQLSANTVPEILRCNLSSVLLELLVMGITDVANFDFMDKPSPELVKAALEELQYLGAVDSSNQLTAAGKQMATFPVDPKLSKVLLAASESQCLEEALTIVSLLSAESVLQSPMAKREEALAAMRKFVAPEGDHITLLNVYRAYRNCQGNKEWCHENFINSRNMKMALDIRKQLRQLCVDQQLKLQSCGRDITPVRRCICSGFFMNAAQLVNEGNYVTAMSRKQVLIHPSSSLFQYKPSCVVYNELVQTTKCYMRAICVVESDWLSELAPPSFRQMRHIQ